MKKLASNLLLLLVTLAPPAIAAGDGESSETKEVDSAKTSASATKVAGSDSTAASDPVFRDPVFLRGEQIYEESCQHCHGENGQGTEDAYPEALAGDLSLGELTETIVDTMPEEDPEACVGEDAAAVSKYLYEAFYSEAARLRNRPPRTSMSRLTAEQLRQSLADLFASMTGSQSVEERSGLEGEYYTTNRFKDDNRKIERVDPVLDFDFGHEGPGEGIDPKDFGVRWRGSLKVERSGRYELVLRSSCSCRMYFGDWDRELINNHVQSQGREEFRRTLYLTGGRAYPIRIDFFQRKRKTEQPPAWISLSWVPPGGKEEIIPAANLLPTVMPATFPLQAKLPADDRSYGYERGTSIDRRWDESTTAAAVEFANIAAEELYPDYRRRHRKENDENRAILRSFLLELVETAFRGSIDDATRKIYIDRQVDQTENDADAIKRVLLAALKSPRFLYPTLDSHLSESQRVANRLAITMFDSIPADQWLIDAGKKDRLQDREQIEKLARRMFDDYRARAKTRALIDHWFELADLQELVKDSEAYPGFDAALVADLRKSFDAFVDHVVWSEASDFRQLLQADWMFTTEAMADFYGPAWKKVEDAEFDTAGLARSVSDPQVHVGLLTHPLLMSKLAYHETSSPIHRGVFLTRYVLGRVLRPPNEAFTPINPELHPDLTTRQRVQLQTGEVSCQVCHRKINSLGFSLENFDAAGRFRTTEKEKPIDASGSYIDRAGNQVQFSGPRELGDYLAGSPDTHRAFVEAAFEHFVKQPIAAYGADVPEQLVQKFRESGYSIRELVVAIAVIAAEDPIAEPQET